MNKINLDRLENKKVINNITDLKEVSLTSKHGENKVLQKFTKDPFPSDYPLLLNQLTNNELIKVVDREKDSDSQPKTIPFDSIFTCNEGALNCGNGGNGTIKSPTAKQSTITINDNEINKTKITMVYPATDKIIRKYTKKSFQIVYETAEIYKNIVLPHLNEETSQHSNEWIYNILEGKAEVDRTLFVDNDPEIGFLLAIGMSWPGEVENLYLNTLTMDRSILSIRSLTGKHLPMLKYMLKKSLKICKEKYNLDESDLRIYVHYQPSFYHFHLHIVNISYYPSSIGVSRAILLSDIITNLTLDGDYYKKKTLIYLLDDESELLRKIEEYRKEKSAS